MNLRGCVKDLNFCFGSVKLSGKAFVNLGPKSLVIGIL